MARLLCCIALITSITAWAQQITPAELDSAGKQKTVVPVTQTVEPAAPQAKQQPLNGYFVLYNTRRQKTKEGTFKNNRLLNGRNYIYDTNGALYKIQIYKDGLYMGDEPPTGKN